MCSRWLSTYIYLLMLTFLNGLLLTCGRMFKNTGDRTWGHLASTQSLGRPLMDPNEFSLITYDPNKPEFKNSNHANHCMIYAKNDKKVFGVYHPRAAILMQMRFDGFLGFPGGLVDPGEDMLQGLNRELYEEMNLDLSKHKVTEKDYVVSHHSSSRNLTLHFYALETSLPDLEKIEEGVFSAKDFRSEVLGVIRVPLYTMGDGYRGFPSFLTNAFIGNSKDQLLYTLEHLKLMTAEEISDAKSAIPNAKPTTS